jgi:hypothetical protein
MEAFNLTEFNYREEESGFYMALKYFINNKWITDVKQFKQLGAADLYIKQSKKHWLLFCFENWLLSVKPDIHNEHAFQNVWLGYEDFCNCDLLNICERIVKGHDILRQLLPSGTDNNYQSSLHNLKQIISFCKKEMEAANF